MVSALLWCAWGLVQVLIFRGLYTEWSAFRAKTGRFGPHLHEGPPEFKTFLAIEFMVLGNALMRVFVDWKNFYPRTPEGFLNTGFTEAQWLCSFAWVLLTVYVLRMASFIVRAADADTRWTLLCICGILYLLTTSAFLHFVFQAPLGSP